MAKIRMEPGESAIEHTVGGSTFYLLGGRPMVRQRVTPIQPRTAAQRLEVNAITDASRAWAWRMTPANQATWGIPCFWGWRGSPWFQAIWSVLNWIFEDWGPFNFTGDCPDPICASGLVIDPLSGSMLVTIGSGGSPGMLGYIAASPPMSAGRMPRLGDTRSLVVAVTPGTTTDIGAAYIARFGRLPTEGLVAIASRFADIESGSATPICVTVWPNGVVGDLTVALSNYGITVGPGYPPEIIGAAWSQTVGVTTSCLWTLPGLTLASVVIDPNPSGPGGSSMSFEQIPGMFGEETVEVTATSQQEPLVASAFLHIVSSDM